MYLLAMLKIKSLFEFFSLSYLKLFLLSNKWEKKEDISNMSADKIDEVISVFKCQQYPHAINL